MKPGAQTLSSTAIWILFAALSTTAVVFQNCAPLAADISTDNSSVNALCNPTDPNCLSSAVGSKLEISINNAAPVIVPTFMVPAGTGVPVDLSGDCEPDGLPTRIHYSIAGTGATWNAGTILAGCDGNHRWRAPIVFPPYAARSGSSYAVTVTITGVDPASGQEFINPNDSRGQIGMGQKSIQVTLGN